MANNNAVNNTLSGQTGTGNFCGDTSSVFTTPNIDAANATNISFTNYATGGIIGTSSNDSAASGYSGEIISAVNTGTVVSNNTVTNFSSISLTAGDWDVFGNVYAGGAVSTTSTTAWISTVSLTLPAIPGYNIIFPTAGAAYGVACPVTRISISGTTTVYLGCRIVGSGTITAYGNIFARRMR